MTRLQLKLRDRVVIQTQPSTRDSTGQPVLADWTDLREVWADIRHTGGLEAIRAGAETSLVKASVRIRYCSDIDAAMRLKKDATIYRILAVLPDAGRIYVDLVCEVVT